MLAEALYYVDKTDVLESSLKNFPSVYIEGAAASGKSTMVKMLLARSEEMESVVFWMDQEVLEPASFVEKLEEVRARMDEHPVCVVGENMPPMLPEEVATELVSLIETLPQDCHVILLGRESLEEKLLALLWSRKLELLPQKVLLFTKEEVRKYAETKGFWNYADEIYEITGGWAGCVDLFLRFMEKGPDRKKWNLKDVRKSYEIHQYIENEILGMLCETEREIVACAGLLPWLNCDICANILGITDASACLKRLERKGILLYEENKNQWKRTPLFRIESEKDTSSKNAACFVQAADYYEEYGYVPEALYCFRIIKNEDAYRGCAIRNYAKVPFDFALHSDVMSWDAASWEVCYLRGMYYYLVQDFAGLQKEISRVSLSDDPVAEEIHLNLCYMDPEISLEDWLALLSTYAKKRGPAQLYHMLGDSRSFLCGIRDLSGLFLGRKTEIQRKANIWKNCLGELEWKGYLFAQAEYYLETEHKDHVNQEVYQYILVEQEETGEYINRVRIHLLCKMWQVYQTPRVTDAIDELRDYLQWDIDRQEKTAAVLNLQRLWRGDSEALKWWKHLLQQEISVEIRVDNWAEWWYRAKGCLYLNRMEKVESILKKLIPFLRSYHYTCFLAEGLFMMAVVQWNMENKSRSLRYVIESLLVSGEYRYVGFYTRYGQAGHEVLESYVSWLQSNEPERWSRKKKYNYGDVRHMTYADYIDVILRKARKNQKKHPNIETFEEPLTMMERIVLQDISQGMTNAQICEAHNLKLPTVKGHLYSMYKKLDVNSRVQAIKKARELEILK